MRSIVRSIIQWIKKKKKKRKAYLNIITALSTYILIIRTKGVRPYIVGLIISI